MSEMKETITLKSGVTLKNRIVMAPMTTKMSFFDGVVTQDELAYYRLRSGEVGAVITAAANVQADGKGWEGEVGADSDAMLPSLTQLAATIKRNGTKAILQIFHAGRMTDAKILRGEQPVAPSAVAALRPQAETPRALTEPEIEQLIQSFCATTRRAITAGFDGVELHGANTYLLQQFFSPHSNRREDQWGGSREKRFRFIEKVVTAVTETVAQSENPAFAVGYRFSPEEIETPGIRFEDTLYLVDRLAEMPLDYLHMSLNDFRKRPQEASKGESMLEQIHQKIAGRMPLIAVGGIATKEQAEAALTHAEIVAIGRMLLIEPHWAGKVLNGKEDQIRTTCSDFDREELFLTNGVWGFMKNMMPDRLM